MRNKLTIILFGLLLAVGWTNVAQAQLKAEYMSTKKNGMSSASSVSNPAANQESQTPYLREVEKLPRVAVIDGRLEEPNRAPKLAPNRAQFTITASATHPKSWYENIKYNWMDANGRAHNNVSITEPATDPYQIAYLLGTTYMNSTIPGIKYTAALQEDIPYSNVGFGWDIPNNTRWNYTGTTVSVYNNIVISPSSTSLGTWANPDPSYVQIYSIVVKSGNTTITSWDYATNGGLMPTGWRFTGTWNLATNNGNYYLYTSSSSNQIIISGDLLEGYSSITVTIVARTSTYADPVLGFGGHDERVVVNGNNGNRLQTSHTTSSWTINSSGTKKIVTKPNENGYTVFLVKVKDGSSGPPGATASWNGTNSIIDYFDTYIDEVQLLTDGTRLNEGHDDAGTMFTYSGDLNRFYFIGKGKTFYFGSDENASQADYAPTYSMYEEFSPTTTASGAEITDFYSKLLYGNSYNVIHDCQGVNATGHYFSMSGNDGTDHKSMTNLIFWIPDHRSLVDSRNYDEEYLPHVGLYSITLEAEAEPVAYNYQPGNRNYEVTLDWVSSLNTILDFPVDQDYELWIYVYDNQGNPVASEKIIENLQDQVVHNNTTYSYYVEQKPESYTIVYRVKGWPKDATNTPGHYPNDPEAGSFFALSNLEPVLIPGYKDFLTLDVEHFESDFALDVEHNYYRNFLTVGNQNPDNSLTAKRIENGENEYQLWRYDVDKPDQTTRAANLLFTVDNNKVEYTINYFNQSYIDEANLYNEATESMISGYTNPDALGCPTHGEIANISEGGGGTPPPSPTTYDDITITTSSSYTGILSITVRGDGQVLQSWTTSSSQPPLPSTWSWSKNYSFNGSSYGYSIWFSGGGTITIPHSLIDGHSNVQVIVDGRMDSNNYSGTITVNGVQNANTLTATSTTNTWNITPLSGGAQMIEHTRTWNFELKSHVNDWTLIDSDGDGYNWQYMTNFFEAHSGTGLMGSESFHNNADGQTGTVLYPNNWMISPEVTLGGTLTVWACGQDPNYAAEKFGVYVRTGTYNGGTSGFTQIGGDITTTSTFEPYTFDLSAYSGKGRIAIVHQHVSDMFWLKIDDVTLTYNEDGDGYTMLNDFLDYLPYNQAGIVVFNLPWKSIQTKLQDTSAGTSAGYFMIQNNGRLRFVMPAGYNNANLKFVIGSAQNISNYHDGTFTLKSSTGTTRTITVPNGGGGRDYEVIFNGISSGDVITITGTHYVDNTLYNYSPDFRYIHVYVEGGHDGISENDPLNLDAIKIVDQFKEETRYDTHAKRYGYVLKVVGGTDESGRPEVPVQHTGSSAGGFYSLSQIQNDTQAPLLKMNVMNADINMTLSREPEIYYFTLDRKSNTATTWEEISKLQRREDDTYKEMDKILTDYNDQICNPPASASTQWLVERFDSDTVTGIYNSSMNYVPIIWSHGDQQNRRVKWDTENRHNSYGAPIWTTGVAKVTLSSATAERQEDISTKWTYGGEECSLYMLDNVHAIATMPTFNNVKYVPYMFRIFVQSDRHKLRGYIRVAEDVDPLKPGAHYDGAAIDDDALQCVWSGYVNDPNNADYGVSISNPEPGVYIFHKDKVDRSQSDGGWDKDSENAIFAGLENIITGERPNLTINPLDLKIVVRFYYLVEGFNAAAPGTSRDGSDDPGGYGAEGSGDADPWTAVGELLYNNTIESVTYVNPQGMQSDKPFSGVNIVITRYSNGMTRTTKEIMK